MRKDDDLYDEEEGARPSSLIAVHSLSTPDPLYDMQLMRELEIINARTRAELGPLPPGGVPERVKRKPATELSAKWSPETDSMQENETMKIQRVGLAAAISMAAQGTVVSSGQDELTGAQAVVASVVVDRPQVSAPIWPNNGTAERELGDGEETWPESMFVEHINGRWTVWVLMSPGHGGAKALDFFSGNILSVTVGNPGEYNDAFVDEQGVLHRRANHPSFDYKDPRPGGGVAGITFSGSAMSFDSPVGCASLYLSAAQRIASDHKTIIWSKVPLYKSNARPESCADGVWDSLVNTALDLRDGTLLITAGKYIFRIHREDMSPVGDAPHLRVVDEADVKRAVELSKELGIRDASSYLTQELELR
jgi:hypothetical protein